MKPNIAQFLSEYLKPFRLQIILILLAITIISSAILGLGYALKHLIDQGFVEHNLHNLNDAFIMLLVVIILLASASYSRSLRVNSMCEQLANNIKKAAYKNIIYISPSYFESHKVSDILSRLTTDLTLLSNSIMLIASFSIRNLLMSIGGIILLLCTSLKLTAYVLMIFPIILLPLIIIGRRTRQLSKQNQNEIAESNGKLEESLSFIKIVQAYNRENFEYQHFVQLLDKAHITAQQRIKLRSLLFALIIGLILASVSWVLWIGGQDVLSGKMSAGSLSSFIFYAILVAMSIGSLSEVYSDWQRAIGALERIIEVIEAKSNVIDTQSDIQPQQSDLLIENVSFTYPTRPDVQVLNNITLQIKTGNIVALVGPSGAGKSTIFHLLLRFSDPNTGVIKLGNIDIRELSLETLRAEFALVPQDPIIFSGTAYENILYSKIDATIAEVEAAAKAAEIFDFFQSLPDGLNTYLGEKGMKLSGGQKQRIAIARAILRNPKILLLDEATSSLDSENEQAVQLALNNLRQNRTTLVIAHRISTIINANLIIVMEKGQIVAQGTHQELLQTSILYQKLNQNSLNLDI